MGAKAEALAKQFEAKAQEATTILTGLSDHDWKKNTAAEGWPIGVAAHHLAGAHEAIAGIVRTLAAGEPVPRITTAMLDEMNAKHAAEFARVTKAETIALHTKGVASAAAVVRGLTDEQLAKRGTVFADAPPMTVEQLVVHGLIGHMDDHLGSIRKALRA